MKLSEQDLEFLRHNSSAAMITVDADGAAKAVRVGVALVDGKLWASGTAGRVRTKRLRTDPRCTLYVHDKAFAFMTLETDVTLLEGPGAAEMNLRLFRVMQKRPAGPLHWYGGELAEEEFLTRMTEERRLIYEFDVHRAYGMH